MQAPPSVTLINFYELGRQPFGLAEPAALLRSEGFDVHCGDLSLQSLDETTFRAPLLVGLYVPMHTATRLAIELLPRLRERAPSAHFCAFGLYAPMNSQLLRDAGVESTIGGEFDEPLVDLARALRDEPARARPVEAIALGKTAFVLPDRGSLPALDRYASLNLPDGSSIRVGFAESTRGCKHLCRHCPVVPVYGGHFRAIPVEIVLADIAQQLAVGATHISFGDPDFLNGPTHALRVVRELHARHPTVTFDATIKVEHLVRYPEHVDVLAETGCRFVTTAVESVDDEMLTRLRKGHRNADFEAALAITRAAGIALAPTFMPFTPWTTTQGYLELLERLVEYRLVESVPPVQLSIRLLVPAGSRMFEIEGFAALVRAFEPSSLGHPWTHQDPAIDALQREVSSIAAGAGERDEPRRETFERIWEAAHRAAGKRPPALPATLGEPIPAHSEPWYCCAEPTESQLATV